MTFSSHGCIKREATFRLRPRSRGSYDAEERQREEAERALASPVQVDVVRAARLRRLAGGGKSREIVRER